MDLLNLDFLHGDLPKVRQRTICFSDAALSAAIAAGTCAILGGVDIETIPYKKPAGKKSTPETAKPENTGVMMMTVVAYTFLAPDGMLDSFCLPFVDSKSAKALPTHNAAKIIETMIILNQLNIKYTLQNGVYDCAWLIFYGMPLRNYAYDSMSMFWSLWPDLPKRLDFISSILLDDYRYWKGDRKSEDFMEYCMYAMSDTESTVKNTIVLARYLNQNPPALKNFFHAHMRCLSGLLMSAFGLAVDEEVMDELASKLEAEATDKLATFRYLVGNESFNPNSPKQKEELIYKIFRARFRNPKGKIVTRESDSSTGAMALKSIRNDHPLFRRVINALLDSITPAKQISNVIKMPRFKGGWTGSRLLTSYDGVGTTTTRYSSRGSAFGHGSNIQNIRKDYRIFARADRDSLLLEVDFSAADDVFVGFESQEQKKIDLIRSGKDTHATNALIFFPNWTYDQIVEGKNRKDPRVVHPITGVRQITKKLVHGGHYLMAGSTLLASAGREAIVAAALEAGHNDAGSWNQDILVQYCEQLDAKFRAHYPRFARESAGAVSWYYDLRREVLDTGGFTTWTGYYQRFLADKTSDSVLRAVAATAGQAGTAGRVNMVMDELVHGYIPKSFRDSPNPHAEAVPRRVSERENGITIRAQTHDSITFNVRYSHSKWQDGVRGIFESFSRPCVIKGETFNVGWEADVGIKWADKAGVTVKSVEEIEKFISSITA